MEGSRSVVSRVVVALTETLVCSLHSGFFVKLERSVSGWSKRCVGWIAL